MISLFRKVIDTVTAHQDAATSAYLDANGGTQPDVGYTPDRYDNQPGRRGNSCSPARLKHATESADLLKQYRQNPTPAIAQRMCRAFDRIGVDCKGLGEMLIERLREGPLPTDKQLWTPSNG